MAEITNEELMEAIEELDRLIDDLKEKPEVLPDPGHDLYRGVMWLSCMSCGNRYVDAEDCQVCRPAKAFLQKYRDKYPWKSDDKNQQELDALAAYAG